MKFSGLFRGLAFLAIGIFLIYWAQTHAPGEGAFGKALNSIESELSGSYTLPEFWYYVCLGGGVFFGIIGILRTYKSMK
jgi:hypothetical protein